VRTEDGKEVPATFGEYLVFVDAIRPRSGARAVLEMKMEFEKAKPDTEVGISHDKAMSILGKALLRDYDEMKAKLRQINAEAQKEHESLKHILSHLVGHLQGESEESLTIREDAEKKGWDQSETVDVLRLIQDVRAGQVLRGDSAESDDKLDRKEWAARFKKYIGIYLEAAERADAGHALIELAGLAVAAMEGILRADTTDEKRVREADEKRKAAP
jgi:hypothetical protein